MSEKLIYEKIMKNISANKIAITQQDFSTPYIIDKPGYYYLKEHIELNFYRNKNDIFDLNTGHDKFGFAAGIKISTPYVILDLNGYSICQSPQDYCVQRFFSLIQLNSFPFSKGVGPIPGNNRELKTGNYCIIKNGTLGLSSHQAIIGNENNNIIIENLGILDFEVSGIMLNNCHNVYIRKITIGNSIGIKRFLPITPQFSGLLFIHSLCKHLKKELQLNQHENSIVENIQHQIRNILEHFLHIIYKYDNLTTIYNSLENMVTEQSSCKFLFNFDKLSPCNMHGIKITGKNPSVGKFHESLSPELGTYSNNIYLTDITIHDLKACIREEAVFTINDKIIHIAAGVKAAVSIIENEIIKNIMQLIIQLSENPTIKKEIGTNLSQNIYDFIYNHKPCKKIGIVGNLDTMGHINKGVLGVRIGQSKGVFTKNIKIYNISNIGKNLTKEDKMELCQNWGVSEITTVNNTFLEPINYPGSFAIGLIVSGSEDVCLCNVETFYILAPFGCAIGFAINNLSDKINIDNFKIHDLESCSTCFDSASFVLDEKSSNISISNLKVN